MFVKVKYFLNNNWQKIYVSAVYSCIDVIHFVMKTYKVLL